MAASPPRLILASASPRRLALLEQIGIEPDGLRPAAIEEIQLPREQPRTMAKRLARAKAEALRELAGHDAELENAIILAADTVVCVGRRIVPKPEDQEQASDALELLSGRNHRVYTAVCVVTAKGAIREKITESRVRFKRLSADDIKHYLDSGEWRGKAGAYAIQGRAGAFVIRITGSYTGIIGLPLYETANLLKGAGYPVQAGWKQAG
jgi:septum formation protein